MKRMPAKTILYCICLLIISPVISQAQDKVEKFCDQSIRESLVPIHPGIPGKQEFWNKNSRMFKNAPSFNNNIKSWLFTGPRTYRYTAFSFVDHKEYTFTANTPYEALTPVWDKIPNGNIYLKVEGISSNGTDIELAGSRMFYKSPVFCPPYPEPKYSYKQALLKGLKYLYNQPYIKSWYYTGKPDHQKYALYCYPAKIDGTLIYGMLMYHKYFPENDTSMIIARKAADYLMKASEPEGSPLDGFPQVYEGDALTAGKFSKEMILMQPAETGEVFLYLYDATRDRQYLDYAIRIANTYAKNQLPNGTWYIRINKETGKPVTEVLCIPIGIINFLTRLIDNYHQEQFRPVIGPAVTWIMNNPVKTYDWTGQFEDYAAASPYENLTKYEAAWFAQYLLEKMDRDTSNVALARELIAFCEDQFVFWEKTDIYDSFGTLANRWAVPCTAEQYQGYVPVDASSDHMVNTYLKAYRILGDPIYLEKAKALANTIVNIQDEQGMVPTFLTPALPEFWLNCMIASLMMFEEMASAE
jgi:hypothetical protein